jgi:hypothetical protein
MRQGDKQKEKTKLSRLFDRADYASLLYFEQVVLVNSETLTPVGYQYFLLSKTKFWIVDLAKLKSKETRPASYPLSHVMMVDRLNDAARFLPPDVSDDSQHLRVCFDDQMARADLPPTASIHVYTFFEDSLLLK